MGTGERRDQLLFCIFRFIVDLVAGVAVIAAPVVPEVENYREGNDGNQIAYVVKNSLGGLLDEAGELKLVLV